MTKLQEAAYSAQMAAGLPTSSFAREVLSRDNHTIGVRQCATYIHAVQQMAWFRAAFPGYTDPVTIVGGKGISHADADQRWVRIGVEDRASVSNCEQACLHELAHIVTPDCGPGNEPRELTHGRGSTKGHHHAWRANFILIVRKMLGTQAAANLRHEFDAWGLPTHR
jgi:putative metallohydrolase (TIGR04338 family)